MITLSSKLSLSPHVVLRDEPQYYGTYVAFDYVKAHTEFLSKDEFRILKCIGSKSASAEKIAAVTQISQSKCTRFLKHAVEKGFVRKGEVSPETFLSESKLTNSEFHQRFSVPFLSAPASVDVFLTSNCNLKCVHCFSTTKETVNLPLEATQSIFDQLEKMRVLEVRINGGEPLLHPNIGRILEMLEHRRFRKVILTNGTLLHDQIAKQLKKSNIIPTVSLDDSQADGHDLFRGVKGTFEKTLTGIETLRKNKVQFGINCCLHAKNLSRIENIINLAAAQGANRIAFLDLKPVGRMRNSLEWMLSQREYEAVIPYLMMAKAKYRRIDVSLDAFLSCSLMKESILEAKKGYVSCRAGRTTLSIFSDAAVYPCNSVVGDPKWKIGDLKKETLPDIWFSKNWAFFRGAVKTRDLKKCRNCDDMKKCEEFYCRLLPYATTGDPFGPSPRCSH